MFMSLLVIERLASVGAFSKLSDRIGSAMTSCNSFFNQLALISTSCNTVLDNRYAISNGSGYAILICCDEYAVLDRKLDTPYPVEVDTPYLIIDQNSGLEVGWIRRILELDTAYWGFLGVGTTLDIFQNIILIPYLEYDVLSSLVKYYVLGEMGVNECCNNRNEGIRYRLNVTTQSDSNTNSATIDVHVDVEQLVGATTAKMDRIWVDLVCKEIKSLLDIIDFAEQRIETDTNVVEGLMKLVLQNMKDTANWMERLEPYFTQ
ncbi:hypothetical protein Tco_1043428 [Tanacetum coccineum]|uniref:Uncharacterized protein n=1 Tax=Tanacetum coccineum TaxID=301880 RepID=A0ABQ5GPL2_9ASTR